MSKCDDTKHATDTMDDTSIGSVVLYKTVTIMYIVGRFRINL